VTISRTPLFSIISGRAIGLLCLSCLLFLAKPAYAGDGMDQIRSLSRLAGMARFCEHYFFDHGRSDDVAHIHRQLSMLTRQIDYLVRTQEQQSVSERYSLNGYQHYQKYFANNPRPCENLMASLANEGY